MKFKRILRFLIITAICYLLLAFNVFYIGEKLVPEETKDYTQNEIPQEEESLENIYLEIEENNDGTTGHFATSSEANLESLCYKNIICEKIDFNGTFTTEEKYNYTKIISKIVQFVDTYWTEKKEIKDIITDIQINKGNGERRWYANRYNIVFNLWSVKSQNEFIELSTHEMGHIADLGYIQWISIRKDKIFTEFNKVVFAIDDKSLSFYKLSRDKETIRKAAAKKKDFCSGYGMTDPFEDFSECFNLYINHNRLFKQLTQTNAILKKKYNFIANIFKGKYISANSQDLKFIQDDISRRPRDTTKLTNN